MKNNIFIILITFTISSFFMSCSTQTHKKEAFKITTYPVHYLGLLPSVNTQIQYQLDLISKDVYFLRTRYLKNEKLSKPFDDIGKWHIDDKNRIVLKGGREAPIYFYVLDDKSLELMDLKGERINSKLNYKLEISNTVKTIEPRLFMQGMYSYMADAALFTECITGMIFPVSLEGDNIALERAYLKTKTIAGQKIKVHLDARIAYRDAMEGNKKVRKIIVKRFIKLIPKEVCQNIYAKATLLNTYWKLTMIGDKAVQSTTRREAHIIFSNSKIKGTSGCNSIVGKYTLDKDKLSFSSKGVAMTRMFCKGSLEKEFISALKEMHRYEIKGECLEIFDVKGTKLARFESVYLY